MKKVVTFLAVTLIAAMTCGCGNDEKDFVEASNVEESIIASSEESSTEEKAMEADSLSSKENLEISDYVYPEKFELTDGLKGAIEQLAIWYNGDFNAETAVKDDSWQKFFVSTYIQGNWDGYDYLKNIEKEQDGIVTKEQLEYIQYSLTGVEVSFDSMGDEDTIDCFDVIGGSFYGSITDYAVLKDEEYVEISATFEKGDSDLKTYDLSVTLQKDPKSCFDGYNIKVLSLNDVSVAESGDEEEHYFSGWDLDFEADDGTLTFEVGSSEEGISFDGIVHVVATDEQKKYVKENSGEMFKVTFIYTDDIQEPVGRVEAKSIEIIER